MGQREARFLARISIAMPPNIHVGLLDPVDDDRTTCVLQGLMQIIGLRHDLDRVVVRVMYNNQVAA